MDKKLTVQVLDAENIAHFPTKFHFIVVQFHGGQKETPQRIVSSPTKQNKKQWQTQAQQMSLQRL